MPKILYLCEYGTLNGGENSLLALLPYVREAGFEVMVASPTDGEFCKQVQSLGVTHIPFSCWEEDGTRKSIGTIRDDLRQLVLHCSPDIVHSNSLSMSRYSGPIIESINHSSSQKIIGIGHIRDIIKLNRQVIVDLNTQSQLIAVSHATKEFHVNQGLDRDKTVVLYNGVNQNLFHPVKDEGREQIRLAFFEEQGIRDSPFLIGWVGQLGMRKGLNTFVEAASLVLKTITNAHFVICGQRHSTKEEAVQYVSDLQHYIEDNNLSPHFSFLGHCSDIHQLMPMWDMLVHSAKQEPLGRVLLEAASCGLPIVATGVGGTTEIFPEQQAILIEPDQPEQTAQSILKVLGSQQIRHSLGQKALDRARFFDIDLRAKSFVSCYKYHTSGE